MIKKGLTNLFFNVTKSSFDCGEQKSRTFAHRTKVRMNKVETDAVITTMGLILLSRYMKLYIPQTTVLDG